MSAETVSEVRQKRPKGFYISDNELVDHLAAEIGIYAFGVYHLLMRQAEDRDGARVSQRKISELLGISTDSARNALATLKNAGLVEEVPPERKEDPPMYLVSYAKDVLAERRTKGAARPEIRTRVKTKRAKEGVLNSGQGECENQDAGERNSGQGCPEFRTPDIEVNQTRLLVPDDTPLPPAVRGDVRPGLDASGVERPEADEHPLRMVAGEAVRMAPGAVMGGEFLLAELRVGEEADPNRVATRVCRDEGGGGAPWAAAGTEVGTEVGTKPEMNSERKCGPEVATPAVRVGRDSETARWYAQLVCAAAEVMNGCGWPENPRLAKTIADALEAHCRKAKCTPEEAKTLAIKRVAEYIEVGPLLRCPWGWPKFFRGMYWANPGLWPYDKDALKEERRRGQARVGMR